MSASLVAACLLWLSGFLVTAVQAQDPLKITLTLPSLLPSLESGTIGEIPHGAVSELRIALNRRRSDIGSGVRVYLNGRSIPSETRDDPQTGNALIIARLSDPVHVFSPTNRIDIEFEERYRGARSASFVVNVRPAAGSQVRSSAAGGGSPNRHALVVGVSTYKYVGQGLRPLAYAAHDAIEMHTVAIDPRFGGIPPLHACLLTNDNATLSNVRRALAALGSTSGPGDVVVIFFAGHVLADSRRPDSSFVVLHDSKPDDFMSTAISLAELEGLYMKTLEGRTAVTFVDAGPRDEATVLAGEQLANERWLSLATASGGVAFAAAGPSQVSKESPDFGGGHGLFTFALTTGLRGEADVNGDGTVVVEELSNFLGRRYREAADVGSRRLTTPLAKTSGNGALPLSGPGAVTAAPRRESAAPSETCQIVR